MTLVCFLFPQQTRPVYIVCRAFGWTRQACDVNMNGYRTRRAARRWVCTRAICIQVGAPGGRCIRAYGGRSRPALCSTSSSSSSIYERHRAATLGWWWHDNDDDRGCFNVSMRAWMPIRLPACLSACMPVSVCVCRLRTLLTIVDHRVAYVTSNTCEKRTRSIDRSIDR